MEKSPTHDLRLSRLDLKRYFKKKATNVCRELVVHVGDWVNGCPGRLLVCLKGMLVGLSAVRTVLEPSLRAFGKASHCMDTNVSGQ